MTIAIFRPAAAAVAGAAYQFRGSRGSTRWPMESGAGLGAAGGWNFALRIGARPAEIDTAGLAAAPLDEVVFVALDGPPAETAVRDALRARAHRGGWLVASGDPAAWKMVLPEMFAGAAHRGDNPYAAVAYRHGTRVDLMTPPRWPIHVSASVPDGARTVGEVLLVSGERQTPSRALLTPQPGAAALMIRNRFVYLNASPFHALQAWLQGQEDLEPWLAWRHRLFWLDEWVSSVRSLLEEAGVPLAAGMVPITGLGETTIVLRHDLDYSRDTSYLDAEAAAGVPAVHAVLRDANSSFWVRELARHGGHESAFHYNTAHYSRAANWIRRRLGRSQRPYVPASGQVTGTGLLRQVRWARHQGIGVATLHRHLPFLQYPEWVDGFDEVYRQEPEVLGGSSMFRGVVLRWGVDRADGGRGTYADFPDAQFPFWLPFKLAHAANGRLLRGWETASVMEVEPGMVEQMLHHRVAGVPQRLFTLNFHPAHARRPSFAAGGSLTEFKAVLEMIRAMNVPVLTLRAVFEHMNRWLEPTSGTANPVARS